MAETQTEPQSHADIDLREYSRNAANSSYQEYRPEGMAEDAGPHVVEVLGKPSEAQNEPETRGVEQAREGESQRPRAQAQKRNE
jgi:hypothetical protein